MGWGVRMGAVTAAMMSLIVFTPASLAANLKLKTTGIGLLPAHATLFLHSANAKAGEESCVGVDLTGELLTNNKPTDKASILAGTSTGCSAPKVGAITTVLGGFPWTVKMKVTGKFSFRGTPRLKWEDTWVPPPPPGVCKYKAPNAVNHGEFAVSTILAPLNLEIVPPWPIVPVASSNLCGAGHLEATFDVEAEGPAGREIVEARS